MLKLLKETFSVRLVVMLAFALLASLGFAGGDPDPDPAGVLTAEDFQGVATQVLELLGWAVAAGLGVVIAMVVVRRGWAFIRRFF